MMIKVSLCNIKARKRIFYYISSYNQMAIYITLNNYEKKINNFKFSQRF